MDAQKTKQANQNKQINNSKLPPPKKKQNPTEIKYKH